MLEITINIPGLKELAEAIMCTSASKNGVPLQGAAQSQHVPAVQQTAAPVQQAMAPVQQAPVQPAMQPVQQAPAQLQQTTPSVQPAPAQTAVPTSAPSYTLDELAKAAMTLMDTGRQAELQGLLAAFGVEALPALPKELYGSFATALREKGAQI